jgi:hypothetical protein
MFSVLKSDSSDEKNKTTEKREISNENENNTISILKRNRTDDENGTIDDNEGFSDPVGKRQRINRSDTLSSKKKKLFRKVCSGRDENFKIEMTKKNPLYIEDLSDEIDEYVDELVMTNYSTFIDLLGFDVSELRSDITCTSIMKNQCKLEGDKNNEEGCTRIPGYYEHENAKKFIPQLYHILQDYGFFYHYLKLPMMDKKLTINQLNNFKWGVRLGRILGGLGSPNDEYRFITIMLLRLRRVQFLRSFDVKCCLQKPPDSDHLTFDGVLENVYNELLSERSDIVKNNPHLTF